MIAPGPEPGPVETEDPVSDRVLPPALEEASASAPEVRAEGGASWQAPILDFLLAIARRKLLIVCMVLLGAGLGFFKTITSPKTWKSHAVIALLPREKPVLDLSLRSGSMETSEGGAKREASANMTLPPNPDLYLTLIRSRPVLLRIIDRAKRQLDEPWVEQAASFTSSSLSAGIGVRTTEQGLVTIEVTTEDPDMSAFFANAVVAECEEASKAIERQLILAQAGFLGQAVIKAGDQLQKVEAELAQFTSSNELINPAAEADASLRRMREIESAMSTLNAKLTTELVYFTEEAPSVRLLRAEIDELKRQARAVAENVAGGQSASNYGTLRADYERLEQDVRFRRDLFATLKAQQDIFQLRAEQPAASVAILHSAVPPHSPAGPVLKKNVVLFTGLFTVLSIGLAVGLDQIRLVVGNEELDHQVDELKRLLNFAPSRLARLRGGNATSASVDAETTNES